jgi:hypothetical protein
MVNLPRDGSLTGRQGYGFSYVIEAPQGYPFVTSEGANQDNSVGAIFRNNTAHSCTMTCHGDPPPPSASLYNAQGSGYNTYLEYFRPYQTY